MKGDTKVDIRSLSLPDIEKFFLENNEKSFRAKQVYEWLWKKSCRSFGEMTNLSRDVRQLMEEKFTFPVLSVVKENTSSDRTIKSLYRLPDDLLVEGVLIPEANR